MPLRVLILGGTAEGRGLAAACAELPGVWTVSSLAGRTGAPIVPAGELRIGGFGGIDGLVSYLDAARIDAVVDATHPFAAGMSVNAAAAAAVTGTPLLRLQRPGWTERPGDIWHRVPSMAAAAAALPGWVIPATGRVSPVGRVSPSSGRVSPSSGQVCPSSGRVFLTTGRQEIAAFAGLDDLWFLARSVEPPEPPMPRRIEVLIDRGPFTVEGERALLTNHRIDGLVTKDSGGPAAKLDAARALGVPVIMVDRPPMPDVESVATVAAAIDWLTAGGR